MWHVYILECKNKTFYTGITTDLKRRFKEHLSGKGSKYTAYNRPIKIRYSEKFKSRSKAAKKEAEIKKMTRAEKKSMF